MARTLHWVRAFRVMSDTLPSPPPSCAEAVSVHNEIDVECSRLETELGGDELPIVHDADPPLATAKRNAQAERGQAVFMGRLSWGVMMRATLLEALSPDGGDVETRRCLIELAAMAVLAVESLDRKNR